jgi:FAD/FMN-containing dehydrogenase
MQTDHDSRVQRIITQVTDFYRRTVPFKIYRGATNATRVVSFEKDKMLDVSDMNHILEIDTKAQLAIVEPNVPMDDLADACLAHGFVPPVVMEFPGITVGGGLQGGAGESSSHKWGTFDKTLEWFDMVQADGTLIRASRTEHADLFHGVAGSYGSLGVVTRVAVRLIPAKRYVVLRYIPVHGFDEAIQTLSTHKKEDPDYLDGIMFSNDSGVILVGNLSDAPEGPVKTYMRARDQWFYVHAQEQAGKGSVQTDSIPLKDYLFRYDRGAFWTGKFVFERENVPFNRFTRWLLDPLLHTRKMYAALQASGMSQQCVIQDLAMPEDKAADFMRWVDKRLSIYPLWLCPLQVDTQSPLLCSYLTTDTIVNVGVWGLIGPEALAANHELEVEVRRLGGKKWLYAQSFYDEPTFWKIYDEPKTYKTLRKKYHAESLPTVYDKVHTTKQYPISVRRGVFFAMFGKNGLRVHNK